MRNKLSFKITLGGIIAALSLIFMFFTGIMPIFAYTLPALSGAFLIVIVIELGKKWAFITYGAVALLSFFLTPDKTNSSWKEQFKDRQNQGKILNLVFKLHLLSNNRSSFSETMNGFEELLLLHSKKLTKSENGVVVWGQGIFLNYNYDFGMHCDL